MPTIHFSTTNQTWRQLFGNGLRYVVPRFQRDYSWTEDQWDDLWRDIQAVMTPGGETAHYLGYLVLQTDDNKTFTVIDGQQRLTTLTLLALAVLACLRDLVDAGVDANDNARRAEQLRGAYVGYLDPVTLVPRSKLTLNRNNEAYYRDHIAPLQTLPQRNLRPSEQLLGDAFQWFVEKVRHAHGAGKDGAALARFVDDLSDRLFCTAVVVADDLNAFTIFETLNARGARLSPADLLKNYLFSVVDRPAARPAEIDALEQRWEALENRLEGERLTEFVRAHWNSRHAFSRETDLFKTIRAGSPDRGAVFGLLRDMEMDVDVYAALSRPESALWNKEQAAHIGELILYGGRQSWPLLLAARRALNDDQFTQTLRACAVIAFRHNVIGGLATNEQERVFARAARGLTETMIAKSAEVIRALAPIYVPDAAFREAFARKSLAMSSPRNAAVARDILFRLEAHVGGAVYDRGSAEYSVEHILPRNPSRPWPEFADRRHDEYFDRLGNLTLLNADDNSRLGNGWFAEKRSIYAGSPFRITRAVAGENDVWAPERLLRRQRWMADQATAIWRISQMG